MPVPFRILLLLLLPAGPAFCQGRPANLDDLMKLSTVVETRISSDGKLVAYVVSTPSLARNQHEPALFVVPVTGGTPRRLAEGTRILNTPLPHPRLQWTPDGSPIGFRAGRDVLILSPLLRKQNKWTRWKG